MKIGAVPYLNAIPLIQGLEYPVRRESPAALERLLKLGELDVATAPVTTLFQNADWRAVPSIAIGTKSSVKSVLLCTRRPEVTIENVRSIYLDLESRTSVLLLKVLLGLKYRRALEDIQFITPLPSPEVEAKLIIGDKALKEQVQCSWPEGRIYDLGTEWTGWTGLPFVFACWVTRHERLPMDLVESLQTRVRRNLQTIDDWLAPSEPYDAALLRDYFTLHMNYGFGIEEQRGLAAFHQYLRDLEIYDRPFELRFITP